MDKSICVLLPLLSLLSSYRVFVYGEGVALGPIELAPIPCNDKVVEKLSRLATTYLNEDRADGYKFAVNRIDNVHLHAQGPAGNVYYLHLDVLETKCRVGSPKPWKRCDVRSFMEMQVSGNCNITVLHTPEGYAYLHNYDCSLFPDSPETIQQRCPTCPLPLALDDQQAVNAAHVMLATYKRRSKLHTGLGLKAITRAAAQAVPLKITYVEFTVQECPDGATEGGDCRHQTLHSDFKTAGFCVGSVRGDVRADGEAQVSCEMFKVQNLDVLTPVQPQGHDLPQDPSIHAFPRPTEEPGRDPQLPPSDPTLPPTAQTVPFDPSPVDPLPSDLFPVQPLPFDPPVVFNPTNPFSSSSSDSSEDLLRQQPRPQVPGPFDSSSEEMGVPVARRPPLTFRYQRRDRRRRQALVEPSRPHSPVFLSEFPSSPSPFRSCPGPSRYTTV